MAGEKRASLLLALALSFAFSAYGLSRIWRQSFIAIDGQRYFTFADDALITLRYGWNLAHGDGLVWNAGERVEGITNLGWALAAAAMSLFVDKRLLPPAMLGAALALVLATAFAFRSLFRRAAGDGRGEPRPVLEAVAFLLPLSYFPFVYWSLRGMETSLLGALMAFGASRLAAAGRNPSPGGAALFGAAFLTRPDVLVPCGAVLGLRLLRALTTRTATARHLAEAATAGGFVAAASLFRLLYYGSIVPNTYRLKVSGLSVIERIEGNGLPYVRTFLESAVLLGALLVVSLVLRPTWEKWILVSIPASALVYTVYVGGDAFPQLRFLAPYVPYAFLALLLDGPRLAAALASSTAGTRAAGARRAAVVLAVLAVFLGLGRSHPVANYVHGLGRPQPDDMANIDTAVYLGRILKPGASVGVAYGGSVPFYTGLYAVDFLGRSDRRIASLPQDTTGAVSWNGLRSVPGHNKYDLRHSILERRPTYVAGFKWGSQDVTAEGLELYRPVAVDFSTWSDFDSRAILLLEGSDHVRWELVAGTDLPSPHARVDAEGPEAGFRARRPDRVSGRLSLPRTGSSPVKLAAATVSSLEPLQQSGGGPPAELPEL